MLKTNQIERLLGIAHVLPFKELNKNRMLEPVEKKHRGQKVKNIPRQNPELKRRLIFEYLKKNGAGTVQQMANILPITETSVDVYTRMMIKEGILQVIEKHHQGSHKPRTIGLANE